jgi:hypothetical protein
MLQHIARSAVKYGGKRRHSLDVSMAGKYGQRLVDEYHRRNKRQLHTSRADGDKILQTHSHQRQRLRHGNYGGSYDNGVWRFDSRHVDR